MKKQGQRPRHTPQRSCIVCRQKMDKRRLTRLVRTPENVVLIDPTGKQNGRGAYICDQPACWEKLLRQRSIINQALKTAVTDENMASLADQKPALSKT